MDFDKIALESLRAADCLDMSAVEESFYAELREVEMQKEANVRALLSMLRRGSGATRRTASSRLAKGVKDSAGSSARGAAGRAQAPIPGVRGNTGQVQAATPYVTGRPGLDRLNQMSAASQGRPLPAPKAGRAQGPVTRNLPKYSPQAAGAGGGMLPPGQTLRSTADVGAAGGAGAASGRMAQAVRDSGFMGQHFGIHPGLGFSQFRDPRAFMSRLNPAQQRNLALAGGATAIAGGTGIGMAMGRRPTTKTEVHYR